METADIDDNISENAFAFHLKHSKKPRIVYVSPDRPDDPRGVGSLKLYPLRWTPNVLYPTNFQLAPPNSVGSTGDRSWGLPLTFQTTPTTSSRCCS